MNIKKNEMELISKEEVIRILKRNQMHSLKRLGQHFLISKDILTEIIKNANIQKGDKVIEVGPGLGVLTEELLSNGAEVTAIEFDSRMMRILKKRFRNYQNLNLIKGDALDEIPRLNLANQKIVANLPYQITSPFFNKILSKKELPKLIVILIQKEVAERIIAKPHNSTRGYLSVLVQLYGVPKIVGIVSKECFYPQPKVESAILSLKVRPLKIKVEKAKIIKIIQAGFSQ
ncbi:MAG: 16S rRNA (adenine(1518)-N(6)/adenine(1519)-N(6))-dimethyltransferase RsmA, partial [Candidatus Berkelbacteria bacterium]|nr:16S rRNA (adenine(1518)-N(6)/adenine(1519)-N(6))-dimethyltransferase RsmA [Candidatus Berkelbacteria bacterium]